MHLNKYLLKLSLLVFLLNGIWEFTHHVLYIDQSGISKYPHLLLATCVDLLIILIILGLLTLIKKSNSWLTQPAKQDYLIIIILSLTSALIIELVNLKLGRWAYTESMPTIGGIGLSPLSQLALIACSSLFIIKKMAEAQTAQHKL